ncbi:MAG TPA: TetR/AcrR family transcriptional regulator [Blastocatellia bacterium]|nr:TetR/AcrR family transcriptional regulator [Blastocatellia bacterium]
MTTLKKRYDSAESKPAQRMAGEDRREQIIEVAVRLFSKKGFRGATTKEIASAAGVNEAIIFRHFATKSELYAAIIDRKANSTGLKALQGALAEAMGQSDDRQVFETLAFHVLEVHERDDTAMRLILYSALEGHELAELITRNFILKIHQQVAEYIKKRMADGDFRRMDPIMAVRGFMGMVISHVMNKKFFLCPGSPMTLNITNRQAAAAFTDLFLASMTNHDYDSGRARRRH